MNTWRPAVKSNHTPAGHIVSGALYPVAEVKRILDIRDATLRTWRRQGLRGLRMSGRAYYAGADVIEFFDREGDHNEE